MLRLVNLFRFVAQHHEALRDCERKNSHNYINRASRVYFITLFSHPIVNFSDFQVERVSKLRATSLLQHLLMMWTQNRVEIEQLKYNSWLYTREKEEERNIFMSFSQHHIMRMPWENFHSVQNNKKLNSTKRL